MTYILVDGYNLIFAQEELAAMDLAAARDVLCDRIENFAVSTEQYCMVVFDGHHRAENVGELTQRGQYFCAVYTAFGITADRYIERTCAQLSARRETVRVVSGDKIIQEISQGLGALRVTPKEFLQEMEEAHRVLMRKYAGKEQKRTIFMDATTEQQQVLERLRRGE